MVVAALFCAGCIRALPGEEPPAAARLYYPGRMALSADGNTAFVVNVNFDQRFNASWLTEIDLPDLIARAHSGTDGMPALRQGAHMPALGGDLVVAPGGKRAYLAHRGEGLLTVFDAVTDADGHTHLTCGADTDPACDGAHLMRLKAAVTAADGSTFNPNSRQYDDPYAVTTMADGANTVVFVGYLGAGRISALTDDGTSLPSVAGFVRTPARGIARLLPTDDGLLLGASRATWGPNLGTDASQSHLTAARVRNEAGSFAFATMGAKGGLVAESFALSGALGGMGSGQRASISGLTRAADGNQFVVLSQQPDAVTLIDVSRPPKTQLNEDGTVALSHQSLSFALLDAEAVAHSTLSDVVYIPRANSDLIAVTSLAQDAIYFFDPSYQDLQLVHRMDLARGQGPVGLLHVVQDGKDYLLVSTFFDHGLTVIEISAANYTDFAVLTSLHDESFAVAPRVR